MSSQSQWFVYMIKASDQRLYTGITTDYERRFKEHQSSKKGAKFFRGRQPNAIVYVELSQDRSSASKREYAIKQLSRQQKQKLIESSQNLLVSPLMR